MLCDRVLPSRFLPLTCFPGPQRRTAPHFNPWNMAVPFDLARLPDLPCSPALRPSVHGATGDEKHDPIWKIYARRALSRSVLDSAAVHAASGLGLFCMASKATQSRRLCSTHSNIKKVPRREQLALILFFSFFFPQPGIANPPCNFFGASCLWILVYVKRTFIYSRVNAGYFHDGVWFFCIIVDSCLRGTLHPAGDYLKRWN